MRVAYLLHFLEHGPLAVGEQGGQVVPAAVDRENRGFLEAGRVERARRVGVVVAHADYLAAVSVPPLEVVWPIQEHGVHHRLDREPLDRRRETPDEIDERAGVVQQRPVSEGDVVDLVYAHAAFLQAVCDAAVREGLGVLLPHEALFFGEGDEVAVAQKTCGSVM